MGPRPHTPWDPNLTPRGTPPCGLQVTVGESLLAGGIAGAVSAVLSQPADVVRANMMSLDAKRCAPTASHHIT
jgi:hypothetical protein